MPSPEAITAMTTILGVDLAAGDLFEVVDISDTTFAGSGTNKKITKTELAAGLSLAGGSVLSSLYDAQTILRATVDDTPTALTVAVDTVVGRITGGNIASLYPYGFPILINAQVGTTYTTVLADVGKAITANNAAAIALTIPPNSSVAYPVGTLLTIGQIGAGQVTITPGAGVTLNTSSSLRTRVQYSFSQALKTATDTWYVYGDMDPLGQSINAQVGTTYTFILSDSNALVTLTNAGAIAATVPANATTAFPIGGQIDFAQMGAGQVTLTPAGGVTINGTPGLKTRAQYSGGSLKKLAVNTWLAVGDLSA